MNRILEQVEKYMLDALKSRLPEVGADELEDGGAVFYMNGKNGTEFDWFVNEHFPCFFIFYNDEENLGAVKAILGADGGLSVYVYGDKGHAEPVELSFDIEADDNELLGLAVSLTVNADEKKVWDSDIRKLVCDEAPDEAAADKFVESKKHYLPMIERRKLWEMTAIVTKKVREEGWKIGYGVRGEPTRESDSGWYFCAGNESDEYVNDPENLELWKVGSVLMYDNALNELIASPYGTAVVRVDHDRFETDEPGKKMIVEKRQAAN